MKLFELNNNNNNNKDNNNINNNNNNDCLSTKEKDMKKLPCLVHPPPQKRSIITIT